MLAFRLRITFTLVFSLIMSMFTPSAAPAFTENSSELFALVNGEPITVELFNASVNLRLASSKFLHGNAPPSAKAVKRARSGSAELLIRRTLVIQELRKRDRYPSQEEIGRHLDAKMDQFGGEEKMRMFAKDNSMPWDLYVKLLTDAFVANTYFDVISENKAEITEKQRRDYYERSLDKYQPLGEGKLTAVIITPRQGESAPDLEAMVRDLAASNDSWESLKPALDRFYNKYSKSVKRDILKNLKINENKDDLLWCLIWEAGVSVPVFHKEDNNPSYYIYILESADMPVKTSFEHAQEEIRLILERAKALRMMREDVGSLREKADIEIFIRLE